MTTLTLALAAVLGVGVLTGCSQGTTDDAATGEAQEQAADDTEGAAEQNENESESAEDDATATEEARADGEEGTAAEGGSVWVMARRTQTFNATDEESALEVAYENDERGNAVRIVQSMPDAEPYIAEYEYDEDGVMLSMAIEGDDASLVTYTSEKDEQGRVTKLSGSDDTVQEYTYNANGDIATVTYKGNNYAEDAEGNWVQDGTYETVTTYDDEGLPVESVYDGEVRQTAKYAYERDEDGRIVKVKVTLEFASEELEEPMVDEYENAVECDDNGNLIRIEELGEDYSYVTVAEYVEIEDPSPWARANAHLKVL